MMEEQNENKKERGRDTRTYLLLGYNCPVPLCCASRTCALSSPIVPRRRRSQWW
jgi:hypothetical protein